MKLYNLDHSPYATRIRLQIRKKGLPIEIGTAPHALRSDAFLEAYPLGKLPLLELEDGRVIPESGAIMEFLEERFIGGVSLLPEDDVDRAHARALLRFCDTSLNPSLFPLFRALVMPGAETDAAPLLATVHTELDKLQRWLEDDAFPGRDLTIADLAMVPVIWYVEAVLSAFGEGGVLQRYPRIQAWWQWVQADPVVAETTAEMAEAYAAFAGAA